MEEAEEVAVVVVVMKAAEVAVGTPEPQKSCHPDPEEVAATVERLLRLLLLRKWRKKRPLLPWTCSEAEMVEEEIIRFPVHLSAPT